MFVKGKHFWKLYLRIHVIWEIEIFVQAIRSFYPYKYFDNIAFIVNKQLFDRLDVFTNPIPRFDAKEPISKLDYLIWRAYK